MKLLMPLFAVIAFAGCARERQAEFRESEFAPFAAKGTAKISGQAFSKTAGGEVRYAAGNEIILRPSTAYFDEWFQVEIVGEHRLKPAEDSRAATYTRKTQADGEGRFEFEGLAPGTYYLACYLVWYVPNSRGGLDPTGGWTHGTVTVGNGETKKVIVTR